MTPQYLQARAHARLATALREYREHRHRYVCTTWVSDDQRDAAFVRAAIDRTRWSALHDLLHTPEPTWDSLRGEGYDELELRAAGGDR